MLKKRILNETLARLVASLRHGEMIFLADAGSGTSEKALYPLDSSVNYLALEAVTGSPSFEDIFSTLVECGDFESVMVTEDMLEQNQKDFKVVSHYFDNDHIRIMTYIPDYYIMRDRCKAVVQTGDFGIHAQAILVAGYQSADIPLEWLKHGLKGDKNDK